MVRHTRQILTTLVSAALLVASLEQSSALTIELKGTASDRIERQRAFSRGQLPLPGTPDLASLESRLKAKGVSKGAPIFLRAFKAQSEVELWIRKGNEFIRFATYPICHWDGDIGPKLAEGDRQTPEGFYTVSAAQFRPSARWRKRFNLGYPNAYDKAHKRTGSYILVHGGCSSVGCFAMTDEVIDEIHHLAMAALKSGQKRFQFHIYPFRMTAANMAQAALPDWTPFWQNLKYVHDIFENSKRPPNIAVCRKRYVAHASPSFGIGSEEIRNACVRTWQPGEQIAFADEIASVDARPIRTALRQAEKELRQRRLSARKDFLKRYTQERLAAAEREKIQKIAQLKREKAARRLAQKIVMLDVGTPVESQAELRPQAEPLRQTLIPTKVKRMLGVPEDVPSGDLTLPTKAPAEEKSQTTAKEADTSPILPKTALEKALIKHNPETGVTTYACDYSNAGCRRFIKWTEKKARYRKRLLERRKKRRLQRKSRRKANVRKRGRSGNRVRKI